MGMVEAMRVVNNWPIITMEADISPLSYVEL